MRVLVYSQIRLFSEVLAECLRTRDEIAKVNSCYQQQQLARFVSQLESDIVLFDITSTDCLADARGLKVQHPEVHILALAVPEVSEQVIACADAGFVGYLPRKASVDKLVKLICMAMRRESICSPQITRELFNEMRRRHDVLSTRRTHGTLTPRESEVMQLLAEGMPNKAIAKELNLSVATIKNHLHNVFAKLHVNGRTEAIALFHAEPWLAESA